MKKKKTQSADYAPGFLSRLRQDERLQSTLQPQWLDDASAKAVMANWKGVWQKLPTVIPEFHDENRRRLVHARPLAWGPSRARSISGVENRLCLLADALRPDRLFVSFSMLMPPLLWMECDPDPEILLQRLQPYLQVQPVSRTRFPRVTRCILKEARALDMAAGVMDDLDLGLDDASWASSWDDNPWLESVPRSLQEQARLQDEAGVQHSERFASRTWRSLWSQGTLTVEQLPLGWVACELRYFPASDADTIARANERLPFPLPLDLPLDLAASLTRSPVAFLPEHAISDPRFASLDKALACASLHLGEMQSFHAMERAIFENLQNPESLDILIGVASEYNMDALIFKSLTQNMSSKLKEKILKYLHPDNWCRQESEEK